MFTIRHIHEHRLSPALEGKLDRAINALTHLRHEQEKIIMLIDDVKANSEKLINAADAMGATLDVVKTKLDAAIAALPSGTDTATLQAVSDALGAEADKIIALTLKDTPADTTANPPTPTGQEPPVAQ